MPLFEYYCTDCVIIREALVSLKDYKKRPKCPKCGKQMNKHIDKVHLSSKRVTYGH